MQPSPVETGYINQQQQQQQYLLGGSNEVEHRGQGSLGRRHVAVRKLQMHESGGGDFRDKELPLQQLLLMSAHP